MMKFPFFLGGGWTLNLCVLIINNNNSHVLMMKAPYLRHLMIEFPYFDEIFHMCWWSFSQTGVQSSASRKGEIKRPVLLDICKVSCFFSHQHLDKFSEKYFVHSVLLLFWILIFYNFSTWRFFYIFFSYFKSCFVLFFFYSSHIYLSNFTMLATWKWLENVRNHVVSLN